MPDNAEPDSPDVLPDSVICLLVSAWVLLFAGRWILFNFLLAAGLMTAAQAAALDDTILARLYVALLCITILVLVLRALRGARTTSPLLTSEQPDNSGAETRADSLSRASARRAKPRD